MFYPCSENKSAYQLRDYREAGLRFCFRICRGDMQSVGFPMWRLILLLKRDLIAFSFFLFRTLMCRCVF